jgi:hypothetical protein
VDVPIVDTGIKVSRAFVRLLKMAGVGCDTGEEKCTGIRQVQK